MIITKISPHAYFILKTKDGIVININLLWPPTDLPRNNAHVAAETRLKEFRMDLQRVNLSEFENADLSLQTVLQNGIEADEQTHSQRKRMKISSNSMREIVDLIASVQCLEQKQNMASLSASLSTSGQSPSLEDPLEILRRDIAQKSEMMLIRQQREAVAKERLDVLSARFLIPSVCSSLRSLSLSSKKSIFPQEEVERYLSSSVSSTASMSGRSLLLRCSKDLPEFLTILPADGTCPYPIVRINMHIPPFDLNEKVMQLKRNATEERESILREILEVGQTEERELGMRRERSDQ